MSLGTSVRYHFTHLDKDTEIATSGGEADESGLTHSQWESQLYGTCCGKQEGDSS